MESFSHYKIRQAEDGAELILYLNENLTEFSSDFSENHKKKRETIEKQAQIYTKKYLPNLKVKAIKIMVGTILVMSFSATTLMDKAEAATPHNFTQQEESKTHTIVPGDTLSLIAVKYGTTVDTIKTTNNLTSDLIIVGQTLVIPSNSTNHVSTNTGTYTVAPGDTLSQIAVKYGTTVDAIKTTNNLTSDLITIGQTLAIPSSSTNHVSTNTGTYTVAPGDTLSQIAVKYGTTVDAIKTTNNLTSDLITIGQTLAIPSSSTNHVSTNTGTYTVAPGDTLSQIAARNETTVDAIKTTNNLSSDLIKVGQTLVFPTTGGGAVHTTPESHFNHEDVEWLSKMIYSEARGESLEGQIAVGAVIMNRVKSNEFPNTIKEVLFEVNHGHYQFSPAGSGLIYDAVPDETNLEAARRALQGEDPTNGSVYFYNPDKTNDAWVTSRTVSTTIGNHVFAY